MKYYLVVTPFFPSKTNWRGPFVYDQVCAIRKARPNYKVVVFIPHRQKSVTTEEFDGIEVIHFPAKETPSYLFYGFYNNYNSRQFIKAIAETDINPAQIVAVHCHSSVFGAYGLALKKLNPEIQVLLQHHDRDPYKILNGRLADWTPNLRYRARKSIEVFNEVDCHIAISEIVKDNLLSFPSVGAGEQYPPYVKQCKKASLLRLPDIRLKQVVKLYNGVDTKIFRPATSQKTSSDTNNSFSIGYIANFINLKRHIDLIQAVESLVGKSYDIKLKLVGSGPLKAACQEYVKSHNLEHHVEFITEMRHENLCGFYNSIDLFVFPSAYDGFGCVALEAAASGVPFISASSNGCCDYIDKSQKNSWTYQAGDVAALSEKITAVIDSKAPSKQILRYPLDINTLVADFLSEVGL